MKVECAAYARAGLMGNPSDGYFGKCLGVSVRNFSARVCLEESARLSIHHHEGGAVEYDSIETLVRDAARDGCTGPARYMIATICRFARHCAEHGVKLASRNFSMRYTSDVPQRIGLASSSALITSALRALMEFHGVEIPKAVQPEVVRRVETEELGIAAGLMDRVVQVYEGCVYMDLDRGLMETQGHGNYESIDPSLLPPLFIAYRTDLAEGSEVTHNDLRERWLAGDADVLAAMADFADYARQAREKILAGAGFEIGPLMDRNFELRCSIVNVSAGNVALVRAAQSAGAHAKLAGSGGAVVGVYSDSATFERLAAAYAGTDTVLLKPVLG